MKKAHRVALKPTAKQESLFGQHAGYARFAYNWAVGEFKAGLDVGDWLNERTLRPRWNKVKGMIAPWARPLSQNPAKYAIIDFGTAAEHWGEYRRSVKVGQRSGRRVGFPRFKRRKHEQGFRADNGPDTVRVDGKTVVLPKIGCVAMVEELRFRGSIREVTINRTAGTWFASFAVEDGQPVLPGRTSDPGRSGNNNRMSLEGMIWITRTGAPWRDLPKEFGNWNTVHRRFRRWAQSGVFQRIFDVVLEDLDLRAVMVDGTFAKVHQHGAGAKKAAARLRNRLIDRLSDVVEAGLPQSLWP